MLTEAMISALLADRDDLDALRERFGGGRMLSAEELQEVIDLPVAEDGGMFTVLTPRLEAIHEVIIEHVVARQAVDEKAASLSWLGNPTDDFRHVANLGYVRHYENGSVYWTAAYGAHVVLGDIRRYYFRLGGPGSYLGMPRTDEISSAGLRFSDFQGGTIYWKEFEGPTFMKPIFRPLVTKFVDRIWLSAEGSGFTPGGRVTLWIVNEGMAPKVVASTQAAADGRLGDFGNYVGLRPVGSPLSSARAKDEATGQFNEHLISYSVL